MIIWYYHDISKYQTHAHLATSRQTFDTVISLSLFWYYHDNLILSWYIKISNSCTLSYIQANIWYYDIAIAILILSRYLKMSSPSAPRHIRANILILSYCYRYIIMILWYYHDISKYPASPHLDTSWQTVDIMILLAYGWRTGNLNWPIRIQQVGKNSLSSRQCKLTGKALKSSNFSHWRLHSLKRLYSLKGIYNSQNHFTLQKVKNMKHLVSPSF